MQGVIYCGSLRVVNSFHLNMDTHGDLDFDIYTNDLDFPNSMKFTEAINYFLYNKGIYLYPPPPKKKKQKKTNNNPKTSYNTDIYTN